MTTTRDNVLPNQISPFLLLCIIGLCCFFSYNLVRMPVLSIFAASLGAGPEAVGFILGASTVTGILLKLPMGVLSDVVGRKRLLGIGIGVFGIAPFVYPFIDDLQSLVVLRFFHGLATAIFAPVALAVVASMFQDKRGAGLGWYTASTQSGTLLGPLVGGVLLDSTGFFEAFMTAGILGLAALILVIRLPDPQWPHPPAHPSEPIDIARQWTHIWRGAKTMVHNAGVVAASIAGLSKMVSVGVMMAFLPLYGLSIGLSVVQIGTLFGIQSMISLASKPLLGTCSDWIGRSPVTLIGMLICAATIALIAVTQTFDLLLILAGGFGLGEAAVVTSSAALVSDHTEKHLMGSAMGVYGTLSDIGHASGPIIAGLLIASWGYPAAFFFGSGVLLIGMGAFTALMAKSRPAIL